VHDPLLVKFDHEAGYKCKQFMSTASAYRTIIMSSTVIGIRMFCTIRRDMMIQHIVNAR